MVKLITFSLLVLFFVAVSSRDLEDEQLQDPNWWDATYTVTIQTHPNSTAYTRDNIILKFGDQTCTQVTMDFTNRRLGTFEWGSTDTFITKDRNMNQVCYVYFKRTGQDGWKPASINIVISRILTLTYSFSFSILDDSIPNDLWFGINVCGCTKPNDCQTPLVMNDATIAKHYENPTICMNNNPKMVKN